MQPIKKRVSCLAAGDIRRATITEASSEDFLLDLRGRNKDIMQDIKSDAIIGKSKDAKAEQFTPQPEMKKNIDEMERKGAAIDYIHIHHSNICMKTDTLMGRRGFNGTVYSECIQEWAPIYENSKQNMRRKVAIDCINAMQKKGCRFLVLSSRHDDQSANSESSCIYVPETDPEKIIGKVVRTLRRNSVRNKSRSRYNTLDWLALERQKIREMENLTFEGGDNHTKDHLNYQNVMYNTNEGASTEICLSDQSSSSMEYLKKSSRRTEFTKLNRSHSLSYSGDDGGIYDEHEIGNGSWNPMDFWEDSSVSHEMTAFKAIESPLTSVPQNSGENHSSPQQQIQYRHSISPEIGGISPAVEYSIPAMTLSRKKQSEKNQEDDENNNRQVQIDERHWKCLYSTGSVCSQSVNELPNMACKDRTPVTVANCPFNHLNHSTKHPHGTRDMTDTERQNLSPSINTFKSHGNETTVRETLGSTSHENKINEYRKRLREGFFESGVASSVTRHQHDLSELSARFEQAEKRAEELDKHNRELMDRLTKLEAQMRNVGEINKTHKENLDTKTQPTKSSSRKKPKTDKMPLAKSPKRGPALSRASNKQRSQQSSRKKISKKKGKGPSSIHK